jgi:hypothetical protein
MAKRRIALLLEIPEDESESGLRGLRSLLKRMWRGYGIRCLALRPPAETATFKHTERDNTPDDIEESR